MKKKAMLIAYIAASVIFIGSILLSSILSDRDKIIDWDDLSIVEHNQDEPATSETTTSKKTKRTSAKTSKATTKKTSKTTTISTNENIFPLDINKADADELCLLDGIGSKLAEAIVHYREENGKFLNIEEIMEVKGIGEKKFRMICDKIYVVDPMYPSPDEDDAGETEDLPEEEIIEDTTAEVEAEAPTDEPTFSLEELAPIELNSADATLLMYLPYVDEAVAADIIALRDGIRGFSHPYELWYVESLTREQVAEIVEYVYADQDVKDELYPQ